MENRDDRYARQSALLGEEGQKKLASSRVLVLGAGGLGSPLLYYLAAAGVGHLTVVDGDTLAESNLNRQILYTEHDLGRPKAETAAERIRALNSDIVVEPVAVRFEEANAPELLPGHDLVALALDNRSTRLLANRVCCDRSLPLVDAGVYGWGGYVTTVLPGVSACLCCWFGEKKPVSGTPQTMGFTPGVLGSMEAAAAVRCLLGHHESAGKMLVFDGIGWNVDTLRCQRREDCPACGKKNRDES